MEELIFVGNNMNIIKREGKYYIRYDGGRFAIEYVENEITAEEAVRAQKSDNDAHEVIIAAGNREYKLSGEYYRKFPSDTLK